MEYLDLNIDNYEYEDILNLFNIPIDFEESHLKKAKKHVLAMHPDKSDLDKSFFLFFSKAYKILYSIYEFRMKANISEKLDLNYENIDYIKEQDIYNKEIINNLKNNEALKPENFNKWFNELFEKFKIENDYDSGGYGDWIKNDNEENIKQVANLSEMNEEINKKKEILRNNSLSKYTNIDEFNQSNYCDLTNSSVENYSSNMFSKLPYEDLKKAHEESIIPVNEKDYKPSFSNIEEARIKRFQQNLNPLSDNDSKDYLEGEKYKENYISSQRAYKLAKQEEMVERINKKWWASLKTLK